MGVGRQVYGVCVWSLRRESRAWGTVASAVLLPLYTMVLLLVLPLVLHALTGLAGPTPHSHPVYLCQSLSYGWAYAPPPPPGWAPYPSRNALNGLASDTLPPSRPRWSWAAVEQRPFVFVNGTPGGAVPFVTVAGSPDDVDALLAEAYATERRVAAQNLRAGYVAKDSAVELAYRLPLGALRVQERGAGITAQSVNLSVVLQYGPSMGLYAVDDAGTRGMKLLDMVSQPLLDVANASFRMYPATRQFPAEASSLHIPEWLLWSGTYAMYAQALTWCFPRFTLALVSEQASPFVEYMQVYGLSRHVYWLALVVYMTVSYVPIVAVCLALGRASGSELFRSGVLGTLGLSLLWGATQIAGAMFVSVFFASMRTAAALLYLAVFIAPALEMAVQTKVLASGWVSYLLLVFPPSTFFRAMGLWNRAAAGEAPAEGHTPTLATTVAVLVAQTVVMAAAGLYLHGVRLWPHWLACRDAHATRRIDPGLGVDGTVIVSSRLTKRFGRGSRARVAVDDVSLSVPGGLFGIVGAHGAGKSTLLKLLCSAVKPSSGTAVVGGACPVSNPATVAELVSVVPQGCGLWPSLTVEEHMRFYASLGSIPATDADVAVGAALGQVELNSAALRARKVSTLAPGTRRRLAIGIALLGAPPILFLDEPFGELDTQGRAAVADIVERIKVGRTVVLATHSMDAAAPLCDRIGILSKGRILCCGTPRDLKDSFGSGYRLSLTVEPPQSRAVVALLADVGALIPSAVLVSNVSGALTWSVPHDAAPLPQLFRDVAHLHSTHAITHWSLSRHSLEDSFINIVQSDELEHPSL